MRTPEWVVEEVTPREDYTLLLRFADGSIRIYDAKPLLKEKLCAPLKDLNLFLKAHEDYGTVVWTDDLDIAPEHLYECSRIIDWFGKEKEMTTISMFYDITIKMPDTIIQNPPHFYVYYQDVEGVFDMEGDILKGNIPESQCKIIAGWATIHGEELKANWERAKNKQPLQKINPLE